MTSKNYTLTIFDFNELPNLQHESVKYSAYGDEVCSTTGRPHKQAFVCFKTSVRFAHVKKLYPTAHIEVMAGLLEHNEKYCSKEGSYHEYGVKPKTKRQIGHLGAQYWQEQVDLAKKDPSLCDPKLQITHFNNLQKIHLNAQVKSMHSLEACCGLWYYGEAGSGKTTAARTQYPDAYIKDLTKWWDGYDGQEVVIMDDMDPFHKDLSKYLKDWADKWPFRAEMKGASRLIRPKLFIVTSQYHYNEIFQDKETLEALDRRYIVTKFNKKNN